MNPQKIFIFFTRGAALFSHTLPIFLNCFLGYPPRIGIEIFILSDRIDQLKIELPTDLTVGSLDFKLFDAEFVEFIGILLVEDLRVDLLLDKFHQVLGVGVIRVFHFPDFQNNAVSKM